MTQTPVLLVNGSPVHFAHGVTLAAALLQAGIWQFRSNLASGEPRGPFCGMGVCFECEVDVAGVGRLRACMSRAWDQMSIKTGGGLDPAPSLQARETLDAE